MFACALAFAIGQARVAYRRDEAPVVADRAALQPGDPEVVGRRLGYKFGTNTIVRCRQGHLFTTIWIPGVKLKAVKGERGQRSEGDDDGTRVYPIPAPLAVHAAQDRARVAAPPSSGRTSEEMKRPDEVHFQVRPRPPSPHVPSDSTCAQ